MLDELSGDHAQSLQLATYAQQMQTDDDVDKTTTAVELDQRLVISMVVSDTKLGALVAKKALTYTGYESSLIELNNLVQTAMMNAVSCTYGYFISPNTPIISNQTVLELVKNTRN